MHRHSLLARIVCVQSAVRDRITALRADPDRGSHSTEYAIGIGASATIVLGLFGLYKTGIAQIAAQWLFK